MPTFKAIVIDKSDYRPVGCAERFRRKGISWMAMSPSASNIPPSITRTGLAITGKAPVVRRFPMIAGVDFAGTVEQSSHPRLEGRRQGRLQWLGHGRDPSRRLCEKARVQGDWLVRLPATISTRDAMAIGTAGYTAMLSVMALENAGVTPDKGPVVVTGAAGGVGSVAVAILAKLGYQVVRLYRACSGGGLSRGPRRGGGHRPQGIVGSGEAAGRGTICRRCRFGRLDHPRQCAVDDPLWRLGRRLRPRRRDGFTGERRALHFARSVTFGHRFGDVSVAETPRLRGKGWKPTSIGRNWPQ